MRPLKTLFLLSSVALVRQLGNMLGNPSSGIYVNARQKDSRRGFSKSLVEYDGMDVPLSDRPISPLGILWRQVRLNFVNNNTAQILRKEIEGRHQVKNNAESESFKDKLKIEKLKKKNESFEKEKRMREKQEQEIEKEKRMREKQEQERSDSKSLAGLWKTFCQSISASYQRISPYVGDVYYFLGIAVVATGVAGLIKYVTAYLGNNRQDAPNNNETDLRRTYNRAIRELIFRGELDRLQGVIDDQVRKIWDVHHKNYTEFFKELIWLSAGNVPVLNQVFDIHYDGRRRQLKDAYPVALLNAINGYEVRYAGTNGSTVSCRLAAWLDGQSETMIRALKSGIDASFEDLHYLTLTPDLGKINVNSKPITDNRDDQSLQSQYDSTTPFRGLQNLDNSFQFKAPLTRIEDVITDYLARKIEERNDIAELFEKYTDLCQLSSQLMKQRNSGRTYETFPVETLTSTFNDMGQRLNEVQSHFQDSDLSTIRDAYEGMQVLLELRSNSPEQRRRVDDNHNHRDQSDVEAAHSSELNTETLRAASRIAYRPASGSQAPSTPGSSVTRRNRGTRNMRI